MRGIHMHTPLPAETQTIGLPHAQRTCARLQQSSAPLAFGANASKEYSAWALGWPLTRRLRKHINNIYQHLKLKPGTLSISASSRSPGIFQGILYASQLIFTQHVFLSSNSPTDHCVSCSDVVYLCSSVKDGRLLTCRWPACGRQLALMISWSAQPSFVLDAARGTSGQDGQGGAPPRAEAMRKSHFVTTSVGDNE